MDENHPAPVGAIAWFDLTVPNAVAVRDFYAAVVGWVPEPVDQGGYADANMVLPVGGTPVAGVCHALGENADLPPQWLAYLVVADLDASIRTCVDRGGSVVAGPKGESPGGRFCVIRDPAGAVAALIDQAGAAWQTAG